ncbi:hypothetical protein [Polyangium aurulentum]|uniref:hypothetical protein n=1 Tax=Polyangium aurulentum TaxID=2567896 RepID=UPI0010ADE6A8|nr:hypothetical protein [Polyangium aurulentum]UQA63164.1 hypothetical protein E8A73_022945 [Polyangium aurulentum]
MSIDTPAPFRRILVAEAPVRVAGERRSRLLPCRVGVLPWVVDRFWLSIIVASTFRFDSSAAARPLPLEPVPPRPFHAGPSAPDAAPRIDDFVPMRRLVDLTLVGHVDLVPLPSGTIMPRNARIGLGERLFSFAVRSATPGKVPLRPPYTQTIQGRDVDVGPQPCHDGSKQKFRHEPEFDLDVYQAAPTPLRYEVEDVRTLRLAGLWEDPEEEISVALPPFAPRALVDYRQRGVNRGDVRMFLDGIAVNLDAGTVDVTWRGLVETAAKPHLDVDRIILGWAPRARWDEAPAATWNEALRELPRGRFQWAEEREDVLSGEKPPPLTHEELLMARYGTWGHPEAATPELPVDEAATIAAELAEQRWSRAEVLARHGIDDYAWGVEERAWAQHLQRAAADGGGTSAAFGAAFKRAQDALATPEEARVTAAQYVALSTRMGRGDPTRVLAEARLGLGAFARIDRRFRAKASSDRAFAEALERLRKEEEARLDTARAVTTKEAGA